MKVSNWDFLVMDWTDSCIMLRHLVGASNPTLSFSNFLVHRGDPLADGTILQAYVLINLHREHLPKDSSTFVRSETESEPQR